MSWPARFWESLRSSMWFLPSLLLAAGILLALGMIVLDQRVGSTALERWPLLFGTGAEGSRAVLAAIAGSMITVAGVIFSITVVTLSLTATQYSPRVLRNFMRDHGNQAVLGVFVAVFAYCLIVLRVMRSRDHDVFVPEISILVGVILALVAIAFLIYFIHHVATSIQAVSIVGSATRETLAAIDQLFPQELGRPAADEERGAEPDGAELPAGARWHVVPAERTGYLRLIDSAAVLEIARELDTVVRMERDIGSFVVSGAPLLSIAGATPPEESTIHRLNRASAVGIQRSVLQDASFGIQQIVDVALKGLSPGVNDTTTAVICVDHLAAVLARAAPRRFADARRVDADGVLRFVAKGPTFRTLLSDACDQVRRNAAGNVAVLLRMLDGLETVGTVTRSAARRRALREQVLLVGEVAAHTVPLPWEQELVRDRRDRVLAGLELRAEVDRPASPARGALARPG